MPYTHVPLDDLLNMYLHNFLYIQSQLLFQILLHANQCKSHLDH